jgi:hypothetical protein
MQQEATIDIEKLASEYLLCVQSLSEELACATVAIAHNDVKALERHVESQQRLCAQLLALDGSPRLLSANSTTWPVIRAAWRALIRNKQIYSKLLAISGHSHQVLLKLCKAYGDSPSHAAEQNPIARSLSCEA